MGESLWIRGSMDMGDVEMYRCWFWGVVLGRGCVLGRAAVRGGCDEP